MNLRRHALTGTFIALGCVALIGCTSDPDGAGALKKSFAPSDDRGAVRVFEKYDRSGDYSTKIKTPGGKPLMAVHIDCEGPGSVSVMLGKKRTAGGEIDCEDSNGNPARVGAQDLGTDTAVTVKQTDTNARWSVAVDLYDEMNHSDD